MRYCSLSLVRYFLFQPLRVGLKIIFKNTIFEKTLGLYLIVILENIFNIFNIWNFLTLSVKNIKNIF